MKSLKTNTKIVANLILLLSFLFHSGTAQALTLTDTENVSITASIGDNRVTIFGFATPDSRVELSSVSVFDVTVSDSQGNFIFDRTYLPPNPSDLCLSYLDSQNRRSQPVCIPPPPPVNYHTDIGPIILPPTISLDSEIISPNSTAVASGQSLPDSQINIYFYQDKNQPAIFPQNLDFLAFFHPRPALALALPVFSTTTDSLGHFSLNLPTAYSSDYRLYAAAILDQFPSPKSNTLLFSLPSLWSIFWAQNGWLVVTLAILVITLTALFYLIVLSRRQPPFPPSSGLKYPPAIFSYPPAIRPNYTPAFYF